MACLFQVSFTLSHDGILGGRVSMPEYSCQGVGHLVTLGHWEDVLF